MVGMPCDVNARYFLFGVYLLLRMLNLNLFEYIWAQMENSEFRKTINRIKSFILAFRPLYVCTVHSERDRER